MNQDRSNRWMVPAVHWLLGVQYLLGGLNWWIKIFPFPNYFDVPHGPGKHAVLDAMIATGWMFMSAKIIELLTGISLLVRRYVPLMLVVSFPVAITTFLIDAMILGDLFRWLGGSVSGAVMGAKFLDMVFFGGAVLAMQGYLMLAYFEHYRPMMPARAQWGADLVATPGPATRCAACFTALGVLAVLLGVLSTGWLIGMIDQWLIPWGSLAITAPPH